MSWITQIWDEATSGAEGDLKKAFDWVKKAIDWIDGQVTGLWHSINTKWAWITSEFTALGGELADVLGGAAHSVENFGKSVLKDAENLVNAGENALKAFATSLVNNAVALLTRSIHAVANGISDLPSWINTHVMAPLEKAGDAIYEWVKKVVIAGYKEADAGIRKVIAADKAFWGPKLTSFGNWLASEAPWLVTIVKGAEGFLVWIAKYEWHEIEALFELIIHPTRANVINMVKGAVDPLVSPLEHELTSWLSA